MVKTFGVFLACHFQSRKYLAERCVMMTGFSISWMIHVLPKYTDDRNIMLIKIMKTKKNEENLTILPKHIDSQNTTKTSPKGRMMLIKKIMMIKMKKILLGHSCCPPLFS